MNMYKEEKCEKHIKEQCKTLIEEKRRKKNIKEP